jgi:predicted ArsR family transcriptional regulator
MSTPLRVDRNEYASMSMKEHGESGSGTMVVGSGLAVEDAEGFSTRQQILATLKRSGRDSLDGLSQLLGISREGVRKHLVILEREGLVSVSLRRGGPGRPGHVYSLTEQADESFPRRYADIALEVLDYLTKHYGQEAVDEFFASRTTRMVDMYKPIVSGQMRERIEALCSILRQAGALAEWDESADGFVLRCYNCRVSRVARHYPESCVHDQDLIERLLGTEVQRQSCMAKGDSACQFLVGTGTEGY